MSRTPLKEEFTETVYTRDRATWWAGLNVPGLNVVDNRRLTVAEAHAEYLAWTVVKHPLVNGVTYETEPIFAHHRSDSLTGPPLGFSTDRFVVVQNADSGGLLHAALDGIDYAVASIGALKSGAVTFCSVDFDNAPDINASGQTIYQYLALVNAHDGRGSLKVYATGIRPECFNTIDVGWLSGHQLGRLNHTTSIMSRIPVLQSQIREYLDLAPLAERSISRMIDTPVTNAMFDRIVERLAPIPDPKVVKGQVTNASAITRAEAKRDTIREMYVSDPRVGFNGTLWGAFQTFSTYGQKERSFRRTSGVDTLGQSSFTRFATGRQIADDTKTLNGILDFVDRPGVKVTERGVEAYA